MGQVIAQIWSKRVAEQRLQLKGNIFAKHFCSLRQSHQGAQSVLIFYALFV